MAIPECDRPKYGHMPEHLYWQMLEGEDPDDRAIREAHGFGYEDDWEDRSLLCRNGCGETYFGIAAGKMRECAARQEDPMATDVPRYVIDHGDITVEAVVVQSGDKTIVQPIDPVVVHAGGSFTITGTLTESTGDDRTPAERLRDMTLYGPCFPCRAEHPDRPPVARLTATRILPGGGVHTSLTCPEGHGE